MFRICVSSVKCIPNISIRTTIVRASILTPHLTLKIRFPMLACFDAPNTEKCFIVRLGTVLDSSSSISLHRSCLMSPYLFIGSKTISHQTIMLDKEKKGRYGKYTFSLSWKEKKNPNTAAEKVANSIPDCQIVAYVCLKHSAHSLYSSRRHLILNLLSWVSKLDTSFSSASAFP